MSVKGSTRFKLLFKSVVEIVTPNRSSWWRGVILAAYRLSIW